jgi:PAS domain-containing protein
MEPRQWEWTGPDRRIYDIFDFPFTDTDGSTLILEMGVDVTERKQAEGELEKYRLHLEDLVRERTEQLEAANSQLQQRNAEMEAVFAAMQDAVLIYDDNMNVLRANPMFVPTYGFNPVGLNVREIIQRTGCRRSDGLPLVFEEQPTPRALKGETVPNQQLLITGPDGAEISLEVSSKWVTKNNLTMLKEYF